MLIAYLLIYVGACVSVRLCGGGECVGPGQMQLCVEVAMHTPFSNAFDGANAYAICVTVCVISKKQWIIKY